LLAADLSLLSGGFQLAAAFCMDLLLTARSVILTDERFLDCQLMQDTAFTSE